ncbi:unnamed protein product, partial [Prorocentrum cordatum]
MCDGDKARLGGPPPAWVGADLGPSAARRAARARRQRTCEAALRKLASMGAEPGPWQNRERAARPALRFAAGARVPGSARRRGNAAWHAALAPEAGLERTSDAAITEAASGPRLGPPAPATLPTAQEPVDQVAELTSRCGAFEEQLSQEQLSLAVGAKSDLEDDERTLAPQCDALREQLYDAAAEFQTQQHVVEELRQDMLSLKMEVPAVCVAGDAGGTSRGLRGGESAATCPAAPCARIDLRQVGVSFEVEFDGRLITGALVTAAADSKDSQERVDDLLEGGCVVVPRTRVLSRALPATWFAAETTRLRQWLRLRQPFVHRLAARERGAMADQHRLRWLLDAWWRMVPHACSSHGTAVIEEQLARMTELEDDEEMMRGANYPITEAWEPRPP